MRVDHIAIAVKNVEEALKNYKNILHIDKIEMEEVPNEKVRVVMLNLEDTRIELLEPTSLEFYVTKFIYLNYYSSMSILINMIYCYLSREVKGVQLNH